MENIPTAKQIISLRAYSQGIVSASKRGLKSYEEAKVACEEYIAAAHARQKAVFGKVRCRLNLSHLLR